MASEKGNEAAQSVLGDVLSGSDPGTQASAQVEGEVNNPHPHQGQDSGSEHTDAWAGTVQKDGSVSTEKMHSDD